MVQLMAADSARSPSARHAIPVAAGTPASMAGVGQYSANRIGGVGGAAINPAWQSAGRRRLDRADGAATGTREHASPSRAATSGRNRFLTPLIPPVYGLYAIDEL